jgi:hypothetical protein
MEGDQGSRGLVILSVAAVAMRMVDVDESEGEMREGQIELVEVKT